MASAIERSSRCHRFRTIERQIELQHVDARLTEEPELAAFGMSGNESPDLILSQPAFARDPGDLELRRGRRDVRVDAGGGEGGRA
jgi:hypothetical protein